MSSCSENKLPLMSFWSQSLSALVLCRICVFDWFSSNKRHCFAKRCYPWLGGKGLEHTHGFLGFFAFDYQFLEDFGMKWRNLFLFWRKISLNKSGKRLWLSVRGGAVIDVCENIRMPFKSVYFGIYSSDLDYHQAMHRRVCWICLHSRVFARVCVCLMIFLPRWLFFTRLFVLSFCSSFCSSLITKNEKPPTLPLIIFLSSSSSSFRTHQCTQLWSSFFFFFLFVFFGTCFCWIDRLSNGSVISRVNLKRSYIQYFFSISPP